MIAIALIMEVEGSTFLSTVCIKESRIKIQDNSLRQLDDPLKCECGATMLFLELYFNRKRVSLEEMYEKAMSHS